MRESLLEEIKKDLSDNLREEDITDDTVLKELLDDVIADALSMSNRIETDAEITILKSNIKKAVKTIYQQRGVEAVKSESQSGINSIYDDVMETMEKDIIRQNKRKLK